MDKKERAAAIEHSLRLLKFLQPYHFTVSIVVDSQGRGTPVVAFDSISKDSLAKLNAHLKKWDLQHIKIWDRSKDPIKP